MLQLFLPHVLDIVMDVVCNSDLWKFLSHLFWAWSFKTNNVVSNVC